MAIDRYGLELATTEVRAGASIADATFRILAHRPDVDVALAAAIEADPHCAGAHALRGLCQVMLARAETMVVAHAHLRSAERAAIIVRPGAGEQALVRALQFAAHGGLRAAADVIETALVDEPRTVLFAKLAHALRFMAGDGERLTVGVDRALAAMTSASPGYGFLLGCRAFHLEERGLFADAERIGREAIALEPTDAWAIHAVGHVYETTGRSDAGLAWIGAQRAAWTGCNNFALHMSWHAAMFHVARGDFDAALDLYDREIFATPSEDYRDLANAIGLLSRLDMRGVDIGDRWAVLGDIAERRRRDVTLTFASLHHLVALISAGRLARAADVMRALDAPQLPGNDQERVLRDVGRPLARLLLDDARGRARLLDVGSLLDHLPAIGGSAAQRDLFLQALATMATRGRDAAALTQVLQVRRVLGREDAFAQATMARLADARHSA